MKTFNIIACIVVLLLALASAVFSYFLYEKRVQFVDGWTSMSTAIQTSAKKINEQSMNKDAGNKLTADALSHKNYDKAAFDATVKNLNTQSQQFVTQYENAVSERQSMSDVLSAHSSKFASYGVKAKFEVYPEVKEEENSDKETEEGEEGEETEKEKPAPEVKPIIVEKAITPEDFEFSNDPEKILNIVKSYSTQADNFFKQHDKLLSDLAKLQKEHKDLQARHKDLQNRYENLNNLYNKTKDTLANMTKQRNYMANILAAIGKKTGAGADCDEQKEFEDINNYQARIVKVNRAVINMVNNRDQIAGMISTIAAENGASINKAALFANAARGIAPLRNAISMQRQARVKYAGDLGKIGGMMGKAFKDNDKKPAANSNIVVAAAQAKVNEANNLKRALVKAGDEKRKDEATIRQQKARIGKLENTVEEFRKAIKLAATGGDVEIKNWDRGSIEPRRIVTGTVTKVSKEYGYIVINIGTETTVIQEIGDRRIPVNPDLESGLKFNVIRGEEFIAEVALRIVGKSESTADIPPSKTDMIKVGDKVVFAK